MSNHVSWNLQLAVLDGKLEDARTLMQQMVESTQKETGAQSNEWFLSEDGKQCHICERYEDSDAVMDHLGSFMSNFAGRFLECFQPTALYVYGEPSSEARAGLDGFGAKYLGTLGGFSR